MKNKTPGKWALKVIYDMKVSTLILAIIWCLSFTIIANDANGQGVLKKRISISFKNERLLNALDKIAAATGVKFTYNGSIANSTEKVSASAINQDLKALLDKLFINTPYSYEVLDDEIFIKLDSKKKPAAKPPRRTLTGYVFDEKGKVLAGTTVMIQGSSEGTITDSTGRYKILIDDNDVLVFSFVGFISKEFVIGPNKTLDIYLESAKESKLEEIAVVAYGTQKKISLVGAQSSIKPDDLNQPVGSITSLLAGRLSGIVGIQVSGQPGKDAVSIYIRGLSNFITTTNIAPLFLVDGVERSIDMLDANDIQSFTVLKDASATAVYGVRGANGVILVQTKRGKPGQVSVHADFYEGVSSFTKVPEMANGLTYMNAVNEAFTTRGQSPKYSPEYIALTTQNSDPLLYPNVNWLDAIFNKTSRNRKSNLNVSGGSKLAAYYLSVSYLNQTGLLKADPMEHYNSGINYNRYNFVSNVDVRLSDNTQIFFGINTYFANGNYPSQSPASLFGYAMTVPPTEYPVTYPGGLVPGKSANGNEPNPYGQLTQSGYSREFNNQWNTQVRLTQNLHGITSGLNFSAMVAYDLNNARLENYYKNPDTWRLDAQTPYNDDGSLNLIKTSTGSGEQLNRTSVEGENRILYLETSLNYARRAGENQFGGLLVFNQREASVYSSGDYELNIPHRRRGVAGRLTYSYANRYFAEVNAGYSGSDNFAPGNRFGFFPAFGVGWLVSEEKFFAALKPVLSFVKLRYSDGHVGSDDTAGPRFGYVTVLSQGANGYTYGIDRNNINGIAINTYGVNTTWATSHKQNLGIELEAFNKVSLTVDIFRERRENVIMQRAAVPLFIGLSTNPFANLGTISNKGIDATISGKFAFEGLALGLQGTFTYNKARIVDNDQPAPPYPWMDKRGHSPIATFGYIADRLFIDQADITNSAVPGDKTVLKPGDIKYRDLNQDGLINAYDMTAIAEGDLPAFTFGTGFNAVYRNFFVNTFFVGDLNAKKNIGGPAIQPFSTNGGVSNAYANITNRWTPDNPSQNVFYPRLAYGNALNANNTALSSWWVKNIGFVRLKTIDLGYNLPKRLLSKFRLSNASVYLEGFNVLTISNFKLWDPEIGTSNGTQYPNVRTFVLGLKAQLN